MNIINVLENRYATKEFEVNKPLSASQLTDIQKILQLSPSSVNIQPWHFIIAKDEVGKKRVTKGTEEKYPFNSPKILNASATIVFCARTSIEDNYFKHLINVEDKDGRYPNEEFKKMGDNSRRAFSDMHKNDRKDHQHWLEKQVYLNIGNFVLGVVALGLDAGVMEGVDLEALDAEFDLQTKGFTALAIVSVGYRTESDYNQSQKTPKSRLPLDEIITVL